MMGMVAAQLLSLWAGACVDGSTAACSLAGCTRAIKECTYPGWGPCECLDPPPPVPTPWFTVVNDGLTKIRPNAALGKSSTASLNMAANEFEGFQLVVRAPSTALSNFKLSLADLRDPYGNSLKAKGGRMRIYREEMISLDYVSAGDGRQGNWPDALIPDFDELHGEARNAFNWNGTSTFAAGDEKIFYIEIYLPQSFRFSTLTGSLVATWKANGMDGSFSVPVSVVQNALTLPSTSSLKNFYNTGWQGLCDQLFGSDCSAPGFFDVQDDFLDFMLDHRLSPRLGWDGLRGSRDLNVFAARYSPFLGGRGSTPRPDGSVILPGAKVTSFLFEPEWAVNSTTKDPALYAEWKSFMSARGWFNSPGGPGTFDYTCDEPGNVFEGAHCPDPTVIPPRSTIVHSDVAGFPSGYDSDFPTLVTKLNKYESLTSPPSYCSDEHVALYAPHVNKAVANSKHVPGVAAANAFLGLPSCANSTVRSVWWYQACDVHGCGGTPADVYYPSLMIDVGCPPGATCNVAPGTQNRAMQWFSYYYGFSGELYYDWLGAWWQKVDPWIDVWVSGGNGDGTLLYPWTQARVGGTTKIPVGSLRLKILRDGMEDYEYLKILDGLCPQEAKQQVETLFATSSGVSTAHALQPVARLYEVRNAIATRIGQLMSNPSLCGGSPSGGTSCSCSGTGHKCFASDEAGGWYWSGQYCNQYGECVAYPCDP
jgi:hypothetical protein